MPVCFQLLEKTNHEAVAFQEVDEQICEHFGISAHPKKYVCGWYESIGLRLACGQSFDEILEEFARTIAEGNPNRAEEIWLVDIIKIAKFLRDHYDMRSWRE